MSRCIMGLTTQDPYILKEHTELYKILKFYVNWANIEQDTAIPKCKNLQTNVCSPGHNQNWIYSDVIELYKMAPTFRDAIRGHFSALFWALKCSFPTVLWEPYL